MVVTQEQVLRTLVAGCCAPAEASDEWDFEHHYHAACG